MPAVPVNHSIPCAVCGRSEVNRFTYSFNISKTIIDWNAEIPVRENPDFFEIIICGTDINLLSRIRNEAKITEPRKLLQKAIDFRKNNPVRADLIRK